MRSRGDANDFFKTTTLYQGGLFCEVDGGADVSRDEEQLAPARGPVARDSDGEVLFVRRHRRPLGVAEDDRDRIASFRGDGL